MFAFRGMKVVRAYQGLGREQNTDADFFKKHIDAAIKRAVAGPFKDVKELRHRILGHLNEDDLERRLAALCAYVKVTRTCCT
jgi:hypothetical protein